ncbi:hypothetical protein LCGC14_0478130 [marine sediment metagenome]|uniref:Uncharacterized protein n=1 Tax=marine sediment metagenome TaxID=412755 RepID=A0A0F9VIY0_9ZZZZ
MNINVNLDEQALTSLELYRKQINRTHGTNYPDLQEALNDLTKKYLGSLVNQVQQKRRDKVSKLYRHANKGKRDQVDVILEVTDDD